MVSDGSALLAALALSEGAAHELILFAAVGFLLGAIDDLAVDLLWLRYRFTHRHLQGETPLRAPTEGVPPRLFAVYVPAWREARVIGDMIRHCLTRWPEPGYTLYIGTYANDPATTRRARQAARGDHRVRVVVHQSQGPTSKADCLNALWRAMRAEEAALCRHHDAIVVHDAEDVVHPEALTVFALSLPGRAFVQLPVVPLPHPASRWVSGHYCDEFAEAHGKDLGVRERLRAGVPTAGVGCAFDRVWLERIAGVEGAQAGPFAADSVTEDYEMGLRLHAAGGEGALVRVRDHKGGWVATRAYFPGGFHQAVRQKSRWLAGIALAGWDRMGWEGPFAERWMRLRDRRSMLAALVLCAGYGGLGCWLVSRALAYLAGTTATPLSPAVATLLTINAATLAWRGLLRAVFTARLYGPGEAVLALARIPLANAIHITAAWRALRQYGRALSGTPIAWDKTEHAIPPCAPARPATG